eukprot:CAMPEP_0204347772 /NCGR_PEP_ID=MMETSP0469-20131031/28212_1 /ASSEMBLY_ACC=CAM_ASM_000384 /TAXON_ID=2969 /ORGANISM="Oxyrrhis marina" /LENGTH=60 /DNA_ID=CAMNT_0051333631 /DNA_START=62 /DNA_END=241 /DNA_ORIENTATION=+
MKVGLELVWGSFHGTCGVIQERLEGGEHIVVGICSKVNLRLMLWLHHGQPRKMLPTRAET